MIGRLVCLQRLGSRSSPCVALLICSLDAVRYGDYFAVCDCSRSRGLLPSRTAESLVRVLTAVTLV